MNVVTTSKFDGIPEGSCIQDVQEVGNDYLGLWCSAMGSYGVAVPKCICREKVEDEIAGIPLSKFRAFLAKLAPEEKP
jgi:hypothetical protein